MAKADKFCGIPGSKPQRILKRDPTHLYAIAYRRGHVEGRAGQRTVGFAPHQVDAARGIASVTRMGRAKPRSASRSIAGLTWKPSTIIPNHALGDSRAAGMGPGSRLAIGLMALKRCVKPLSPSAIAARVWSYVAIEWPSETRAPD